MCATTSSVVTYFRSIGIVVYGLPKEVVTNMVVLGTCLSHGILRYCNIAPWLSSCIQFCLLSCIPISRSSLRSDITSWVAILNATYSASTIDSETVTFFFLRQITISRSYGHKRISV